MSKAQHLLAEVPLFVPIMILVLSVSGCCTSAGSACTEDSDCCTGLMCDDEGICRTDPCYMSFSGFGDYMPNPASVYCGRIGGEIRTEDGPNGQYGVCTLPDGSERDEWELYCGDCEDGVGCWE